MSIPVFEPGNTIEFTFTSSIAPDAAPSFAIFNGPDDTLVDSATSVASDSTHHAALKTMPGSDGFFYGEWKTEKTTSGATWPFIRRFPFKVKKTEAQD